MITLPQALLAMLAAIGFCWPVLVWGAGRWAAVVDEFNEHGGAS